MDIKQLIAMTSASLRQSIEMRGIKNGIVPSSVEDETIDYYESLLKILNAVEREAVATQVNPEEGSYCMNYDPRTNESHCVQQCDGCKEAEKNSCRAYP